MHRLTDEDAVRRQDIDGMMVIALALVAFSGFVVGAALLLVLL